MAIELVTAVDERERCCVMNGGERCPNRSKWWVGTQPLDDYTHACDDHLETVRRVGDTVAPVG